MVSYKNEVFRSHGSKDMKTIADFGSHIEIQDGCQVKRGE
jgi:hypothetical protein